MNVPKDPIDQVIESTYKKYLTCFVPAVNDKAEAVKAKVYQSVINDLFFIKTGGKTQESDPAGYLAFWSMLGEKFGTVAQVEAKYFI